MNPIAQVRGISRDGQHYDALMFWCPGCEFAGDDGVMQGGAHMLPITGSGPGIGQQPSWTFNGNTERPTLSPSILTDITYAPLLGQTEGRRHVCHSFMVDGVLQFLSDCTHQYAGQNVPLTPLPDWLARDA